MTPVEGTWARSLRMLILSLFLVHAQAAVVVHYFPQASCNANTALLDYTNPNPAPMVTDCYPAPPGTAALYVDGVDEGCTIRTYTDAACSNNLGLSITVGTCYFKESTSIGSWRVVCASPSSDTTVTMSLMSTAGSEMASAPESTMGMATATPGTEVAAVLTSTETVTPSMTQAIPATDGAPMPTKMPSGAGNGSNGTDWNMTHSKLNPSGSPGLQGTGTGSALGISGGQRSVKLYRGLVRVLEVVIAVSAIKECLI